MIHLAGPAAPPLPLPCRAWNTARRAIIEAQAGGDRLASLLGPPGIGKTFLLAELERHFRQAGHAVERLGHGDLATGEETAPILLIDEADRMDEAALRRLSERGQGFAVLAALPGFHRRLDGLPHTPVRLAPLDPSEIAPYVANRLAAMGLPTERFTTEALAALATASGGVPRLLNTLIGSSAFSADMDGEARVAARHVAAAAALRAEVALPPDAAPPRDGAREAPEPPSGRALVRQATPPVPVAALPVRPARRRGLSWLGKGGAALLLLLGGAAWLRHAAPPGPMGDGSVGDGSVADGSATEAALVPTATAAPAAVPEASPTARLAAMPLPRVVMTYPRRDPATAERGLALAATLASAGWIVGSPFPVAQSAGAPSLRFFFHEDREAALALAEVAGAELAGSGAPQPGSIPPGAPLPRPGTLELALPASLALAGPVQVGSLQAEPLKPPAAPTRPPPAAALPAQPADRAGIALEARPPVEVVLRWSVPGGATPGCCFVEVVALPARGEPSRPREIFAGYADQPDSQALALGEARSYAWRVITVSREAQRYAAGPWASFSLRGAP